MSGRISVIIPNYNGAKTIGQCLGAVFALKSDLHEVIVVDDCSDDDSVGIINKFPCRLIRLDTRSGAARARNEGARQSSGDILFFTDADCLVMADTLRIALRTMTGSEQTVIGGTYSPLPYDKDFFSIFQSIFINYSETKNPEPDYIASHGLLIGRELFLRSGGFPEVFLPIIEDVEFSHRLKRSGIRLVMNPDIQVTHIFNFDLKRSLRNAYKKTRYWTIYSLRNKDLTKDSGTASLGLKMNVIFWAMTVLLATLSLLGKSSLFLIPIPPIILLNLILNRGLIKAFHKAKGISFAVAAVLYYSLIYPAAIACGGLAGAAAYYTSARGGKD
ncbi:MAG: glycosyltransferase [Nitrospirae bacterium]|nr:MAG: glycosyltransferase [Nitrospirota bacterium]